MVQPSKPARRGACRRLYSCLSAALLVFSATQLFAQGVEFELSDKSTNVRSVGFRRPHHCRCGQACAPQCGCQCHAAPYAADAMTPAPEGAEPSAEADAADAFADTAGDDFLAGSFGATPGPASAGQGVIGDFFGGFQTLRFGSIGQVAPATVPIAAGDRKYKFSDNNSAFPQDRVFFNYHHFNNSVVDVNGNTLSVTRYTFGIEKTLRGGLWSAEIRVPFASGLDSNQVVNAIGPAVDTNFGTEFGNIALAVKRLLMQTSRAAVSAGFAIQLPTAEDALIQGERPFDSLSVLIENEAVHLIPFLGIQLTPTEYLWAQIFVQGDFDLNGNPITFNDAVVGRNIFATPNGVLQDQNLLFLDLSIGYWLYRDAAAIISGIAPIVEIHYTSTITKTDTFDPNAGNMGAGTDVLTNPFQGIDLLNLTGGVRIQLGSDTFVTVSAVVPLRGGGSKPEEAQFDSEVSLFVVRNY